MNSYGVWASNWRGRCFSSCWLAGSTGSVCGITARTGDNVKAIARYLNLWASLARFSLLGEMAFRGNFVVKVFVELLWLAILLLFNFTLFEYTQNIADWDQHEYLFFLGCYFAMAGLLEMLFLSNCNEFSELVRTGDLDFFLLRPLYEQFMVSCRTVDCSCAPTCLLGTR